MTLPFLSTVIVPKVLDAVPALPSAGSPSAIRLTSDVWPPSAAVRSAGAVSAGAGCRLLRCRFRLAAAALGFLLAGGCPPCPAFELLEAELVVFLHLAHLLLHLQDLEVEFLDLAVHLPQLLFELRDARICRLRQLHDPAASALSGRTAPGQSARR